MSFLGVLTDLDAVDVVTDTLRYDSEGKHAGYVTKAIALPHIDAVIAHTGLSTFGSAWVAFVQEIAPTTIEQLFDAAAAMGKLWRDIGSPVEDLLGARATSSIVHAGWSQRDGVCRTFQYTSDSDFEPENISSVWLVQPWTADLPEPPRSDDAWVDLAARARADAWIQPSPTYGTVLVGGDVIRTTVRPDSITQRRLHTF